MCTIANELAHRRFFLIMRSNQLIAIKEQKVKATTLNQMQSLSGNSARLMKSQLAQVGRQLCAVRCDHKNQ